MNKKLYSLDGYSNIVIDFKRVDLVSCEDINEMLNSITDHNVIVAQRDVSVYAAPAVLNEKIDDRKRCNLFGRVWLLTDDFYIVEEKDVATDSMVVYYSDGQATVVRGERFQDGYELINDEWQLYKPIDVERKFMTITENVYFKTVWGEIILAPAGSKICIDRVEDREFFVVTNSFFKVAYRVIDEVQNT